MSATGRMFKDEQDKKDEMIQELVEALEGLCSAIDNTSSQIGDFEQYDKARAVINKVKCQPPKT